MLQVSDVHPLFGEADNGSGSEGPERRLAVVNRWLPDEDLVERQIVSDGILKNGLAKTEINTILQIKRYPSPSQGD